VRDMSPKRFSMSGKKSLLGKTLSSWESIMKNSSVVAQSAPQKPYRLSPIQDRKRWGSGGLRSWLAVQAARRDGEDCQSSAVLWNREAVDAVCYVFAERSDISYITTEGGEQAALGSETNNQKMNQTDSYSFPT
jgi:hypothetical protein